MMSASPSSPAGLALPKAKKPFQKLRKKRDALEREQRGGEGSGGSNSGRRKRGMSEVQDDDVHVDELLVAPEEKKDEEEEDEDEDEVGGAGSGKAIARRNTKRRRETYMLREMLDVDQGKRYDAFTVTALPKSAISRLNRDLYDQHVNPNLAAVLAGMGKIFVAEVVEIAKDIQEERGERGPLAPIHLRLAKARMEDNGLKAKRGLFRR